MALTVSVKKTGVAGDMRVVVADVTFDSSYTTGGLALAASDLGLKGGTILALHGQPTQGYQTPYDHSAGKLMAFRTGAALASAFQEVPATTNLTTVVSRVFALISGV